MTLRYTWTPASEPPDTRRLVSVWCCYPGVPLKNGWPDCSVFIGGHWTTTNVTHWRDVEPPEAGE